MFLINRQHSNPEPTTVFSRIGIKLIGFLPYYAVHSICTYTLSAVWPWVSFSCPPNFILMLLPLVTELMPEESLGPIRVFLCHIISLIVWYSESSATAATLVPWSFFAGTPPRCSGYSLPYMALWWSLDLSIWTRWIPWLIFPTAYNCSAVPLYQRFRYFFPHQCIAASRNLPCKFLGVNGYWHFRSHRSTQTSHFGSHEIPQMSL